MKIFQCLLMLILMTYSVMSLAVKTENNVYTEDKTNITVTAQHPEFVLKLKSNPTTGYSWFLQDYNSNLITPVKHSFQPTTSQLVGAGGFDVWTFHVKPAAFIVPQQSIVRMIYARAWEKNESGKEVDFKVSMQ